MGNKRIVFPFRMLGNSLLAVLSVFVLTIPLVLIGKQMLGEAVIALLYLVPVTWSAGRWGLLPGLSAALAASLCFDFLFIPPFYTFVIGRLEGWLVLAIFLGVAVFVVESIQASLVKAREAVFMYELSSALAGKRTQEAAARTVAQQVRQLFQASLVRVSFRPENHSPNIIVSEPKDALPKNPPDRTIPIENAWGLVGEIQIWRGESVDLPLEDSPLLLNFATQTAQALERTRLSESREAAHVAAGKAPAKEG
jgi:K+-sensing histidine kinase KdpD